MMANKGRVSQVDYDWQSGKTGSECNKYMLDNEICCDVTFLLGDKRREVKAHKYILISRSCVFHAMFCGPLAETTQSITVPDIEAEVFKLLLRYMYCDTTDIKCDQALPVLYAAKKYALQGLADKCVTILKDGVNAENVCCILEQAFLYEEVELKQKCLDFMRFHSENVLRSAGFLCLDAKIVKMVISSHIANVSEIIVYESLVLWASEECKRKSLDVTDTNKRTVLGNLLFLIRFPTMEKDDFVRKVSKERILNAEEKNEILQYLLMKDPELLSNFTNETRVQKPTNKIKVQQYVRIIRFKSSGDGWVHDGLAADAIGFSCNKPAVLCGVVVCRNLEGNERHRIDLTILDSDRSKLLSQSSVLSTKVTEELYDVLFERPVTIQPFQTYTVKMDMVSGSTKHGKQGQASVTEGEFEVSFFKSGSSVNRTNVSRGQLPGLLFQI